jgi:hypothetical protein
MAAADTAAVLAVSAARGVYGPMTTVRPCTSFPRAVTGSDVLIEAVVDEPGRRTAFADIPMTDEASGRIAVRASTVCALLGRLVTPSASTRTATGRQRCVVFVPSNPPFRESAHPPRKGVTAFG